ncbi:MAG: class II fumarate hydratase [Planctomycetes bacterium]|nr:class II fumarate hydratase [Planctomycetota bacterium]
MSQTRIEKDSMGEMAVPLEAYWAASTQRAHLNFQGISGRRFPRSFIRALGLIKRCAAETNKELGKLDERRCALITQAADEVAQGTLDAQFILDVYQTGSGTSTNMNANEVIATRANEVAGLRTAPAKERPVHQNDHVNMGQSSNDVIPTASHVSAAMRLQEALLPALERLENTLRAKAEQFATVMKIGRTHLQDATPVTMGQVFSGWATQIARARQRIDAAMPRLCELALGGTAVGTGINTHKDFARLTIARLSKQTGLRFSEAENHFEAQGSRDAMVEMSGALKVVAVSLMKISNDVRWLSSGPRCGIGELALPATQPGSSIMPGKVNPVIAEAMTMVCAQVMGNDVAVTVGGQSGVFELNVMIPVMTINVLDSVELLAGGVTAFEEKCVRGIEVDVERCEGLIEGSLAMCTSLAPLIGYEAAADIAKDAWKTRRTVREVALARAVLPAEQLAKVLDPRNMIHPDQA